MSGALGAGAGVEWELESEVGVERVVAGDWVERSMSANAWFRYPSAKQ